MLRLSRQGPWAASRRPHGHRRAGNRRRPPPPRLSAGLSRRRPVIRRPAPHHPRIPRPAPRPPPPRHPDDARTSRRLPRRRPRRRRPPPPRQRRPRHHSRHRPDRGGRGLQRRGPLQAASPALRPPGRTAARRRRNHLRRRRSPRPIEPAASRPHWGAIRPDPASGGIARRGRRRRSVSRIGSERWRDLTGAPATCTLSSARWRPGAMLPDGAHPRPRARDPTSRRGTDRKKCTARRTEIDPGRPGGATRSDPYARRPGLPVDGSA